MNMAEIITFYYNKNVKSNFPKNPKTHTSSQIVILTLKIIRNCSILLYVLVYC